MNALGVALSPDGRFAIVSNDDERQESARSLLDPRVHGGYSLSVVDTHSMKLVDQFVDPTGKISYFSGIVSLDDPAHSGQTLVLASGGGDNALHFYDLSAAGALSPDATPSVDIPGPSDAAFANRDHSFPGSIALSRDKRFVYVVDNLGNDVAVIDIPARRLVGSRASVGYFPFGVALAGDQLLVTDEGLQRYPMFSQPVRTPEFRGVTADQNASALSVIALSADGGSLAGNTSTVAMDPTPNGVEAVGGAHPTSIAASPSRGYAFVTMTNVDRIATVALKPTPHVVAGLDLRLFYRAPYGTQPIGAILSKDGRRLYVALSGLDAVAVIDSSNPLRLRRLGLIPTGWYPTALALSADGRYLYVANAKGKGQDKGFQGGPPFNTGSKGQIYQAFGDSNTIWATLQQIDLHKFSLLTDTRTVLGYTRLPHAAYANPIVPPQRSLRKSSRIKHVVLILEENKTFDSMLGDLKDDAGRPYGNGDPNLVSFGQSITPNLHELARTFGIADNFYADGDESDAGHQFTAGGITSSYSERTLLVKDGRGDLVNKNEDVEDYPRAGYIFNGLAHQGATYRDYGDLIRISGYDEGRAHDPRADDPNFVSMADQSAPTAGLGGLYDVNVPALAALKDHVDLDYPGWNLRIRDVRRAKEFIRDYAATNLGGAAVPAFTYIWLPDDHGGRGADIPPLPEEVADGDRALGMVVEYLTHLPSWSSTAIFIMPDDAQSSRDHVNEHRSYAIVVSPYAKRRYIGKRHTSTVSVLKTEEEMLGLPPLALGDLLATDLSDFFTTNANLSPYTKIDVPTQVASAEGNRIADLLLQTDQNGPDADVKRSARIIELSRLADKLANRRAEYSSADYAARQQALYTAARDVVARGGEHD